MYRRVRLISLSDAECRMAIPALVLERVFEEPQLNTASLLERLVWTNEQHLLPGWSQPIRGLPAIQSIMFLCRQNDDVMLTHVRHDITLGHLEPGCSTEHWCFGLLLGTP